MKKRLRLLHRGDFQRVLREPLLFAGRTLIAFAAAPDAVRLRPPGLPLRVGVTAARRFPDAVSRNRARRRLREGVRETWPVGLAGGEMGTCYDVVLIARAGALVASMEQIAAELRTVWGRL